jgi:L-2,4-diaminobutyrate decarboxylase
LNFESDAKIVVEALKNYYEISVSGKEKVITQPFMSDIVEDLNLEGFIHEGGLTEKALSTFLDRYLAMTTRLHHPGYMAHQVAVPHFTGGLAAMVDGFTNNAMAIYEMGPAAAAIEAFVINWMLKKIGWSPAPYPSPAKKNPEKNPPSPKIYGGGVLTHGGSLANLTALIAARSRLVPDVWAKGNPPDLALLAPAGSHYSIARAAGVLGVGGQALYPMPVDPRGVVIPDRLPETLNKLRKDGKRPVALIANACSTAVGLYDPLSEIGDFCRAENIWFHVDGAHGASALVSPKHHRLLTGAVKADSLVWDTHKLLRTPTLCAAVLVKNARTLDTAFYQEASYLFHEKDQPGFDFIHRTVECTKAGLGLRFYTVLASLGEKRLAAYIDDRFDLAVQAWEYLSSQPDFECAVRPESNIVCFRLRGSDSLQLSVRDRILAEGNFYISSTEFGGKRWLRLALMNPDTGTEDVKILTEHIRKAATLVQ